MKLPSGWVFIPVSDSNGKIKVEQKDLVLCRECKSAYLMTGPMEKPLYFCALTGLSARREDDYCSRAEKSCRKG